ncbi:MAG TPA: type II toxin-antitoxin system HicA family toxin [Methanofastidiosum sp.]|nr:type II toxin-antitoxin system HicA family toxin [Methanofastidiosum sp.]
MSKKLVPLAPEKIIKILEKFGFKQLRQKGSHLILENTKGKIVIVPIHDKEIGKGLLRRILKEAEIEKEEFLDFL